MSLYERYKRPILIGVALFALVTFSVTGVMMAVFRNWFAPRSPERITLADGRSVTVTAEDYQVGRALYQLHVLLKQRDRFFAAPNVPQVEMPAFVFDGMPPDFTAEPQAAFAILRRVAVERGIDVADEEVEKVREFACRKKKNPFGGQNQPDPPVLTPLQLAHGVRLGSVTALDGLIREAIRISTLVRAEMSASLDLSDAELAAYIEKERKKLTLSYVAWQGKAFEDEIRRLPTTDQELQAWIQQQPAADQGRWRYDLLVSFASVGLRYDEVDLAGFAGELKDVEIGDADIEQRYNEDRETFYKRPEPPQDRRDGDREEPGPKPGKPDKPGDGKDDEDGGLLAQKGAAPPATQPAAGEKTGAQKGGQAKPIGPPTPEQAKYVPLEEVKAEIRKKLQVEAILRKLLERARKDYEATTKKPGPAKDPGARKKPGDDKNGGLLQDAKTGTQTGKDAGKQGAAESRAKTATEPAAKPPEAFDLGAWFAKVAKGRKGLVFEPAGAQLLPPEKYQDLKNFGRWDGYWALSSIKEEGVLSGSIQRATKGCFFFQVAKRKKNVLRPIDEIRKDALEAFVIAEAGKKAKERAAALRKLVREKAEALEADKTKKLREAIATKVGARLDEWRKDLEGRIAKKRQTLAGGRIADSAKKTLEAQIKALREQLAGQADEKKRLEAEVGKAVDEEITKVVEPVLAAAFDLAVEAAGVEPKKVGPFFKDVSVRGDPLFTLREAGPAKFLEDSARAEIQAAKKGWVSEPIEDSASRSWYIVRMDDVSDGGDEAVTRRMLATLRGEFTDKRVRNVLEYGYGITALKARYKFQAK